MPMDVNELMSIAAQGLPCMWCGEPLKFVPGKGWTHQDGSLYRTRTEVRDDKEITLDDHCAMPGSPVPPEGRE